MNKLIKLLLKIYAVFVKKTHDYIIFESGSHFYDNAYALFEFVKKNYPQYKIKYCVTFKQMKKECGQFGINKNETLNIKNKLTLYRYSLKCKVIFFSYTNYWKKLKLPEDIHIVYTNHGEFPIKDCTDYYNFLFELPQENIIDIAMLTEYAKDVLNARYPVLTKHREVIVGCPRNDIMFHNDLTSDEFLKRIGAKDWKDKDIILSMTTFRHPHEKGIDYFKEEFPIALTQDELEYLNQVLKDNNQILLIKLHPSQDGVIMPKNLDNIYFITDKHLADAKATQHTLYSVTKSLLTDYSSAYFGFLNLDRKLGFILADKDKYLKDRGWTLDNTESIMPGDKIYNKNDLFNYFNSLKNADDPYKDDRRNVLLKFCGDYKDQNCQSYADRYLK